MGCHFPPVVVLVDTKMHLDEYREQLLARIIGGKDPIEVNHTYILYAFAIDLQSEKMLQMHWKKSQAKLRNSNYLAPF